MSWWLAVPLGALVVAGCAVALIVALAAFFGLCELLVKRVPGAVLDRVEAVVLVAMGTVLFGMFAYAAATWLRGL